MVESNIENTDNWFAEEDKTLTFTTTAADGVTPVDITTWALRFEMFDPAGASIFFKTTGSGITISDGPNGVAVVSVAAADIPAADIGTNPIKFSRTDAGDVTLLHSGTAEIR